MNKGIIIISAAAMTAMIVTGCSKKEHQSTAGIKPAVEVAYPQIDSVVLHREYPGRIAAGSEVDVVAEVNRRILRRNYE